jgi:integrase
LEQVEGRGLAALELYKEQRDDLHAGRTPRNRDGLTVKELCDEFMNAKLALLDNGELSPRTFHDYHATVRRIADAFGRSRLVDDLAPDDFARLRKSIAKTRGVVALGNEVQRVRTVFKYAYDEGKIEKPVRYGQSFTKPSRKNVRKARLANGKRMFHAEQLRRIIKAAKQPLKAMVFLGINCGFGQSDVSNLPQSALDLKKGWVEYPRPKTAIERRCPLWPETVEALRDAIANRPAASDRANAG